MSKTKLEKWQLLYDDARSKRAAVDALIPIRKKLYKGNGEVTNRKTGNFDAKATCFRNMCFELIETQINNGIPAPKVTPRNKDDKDLAAMLENHLRLEMDRMDSEAINDAAERGVLVQGTAFYLVGWDNAEGTPVSQGELYIKHYPLEDVYPQPGISDLREAEYIFTLELVSIKKIKKQYNVTVPDEGEYKGLRTLVTAWYLNDDGYISRFGWIENTDIVVFDEDAYELRKFKVCKDCGAKMNGDKCLTCGSTEYEYKTQTEEAAPEDIVMYDPADPENATVLVKKGAPIPFYKINQLPFVLRNNISSEDSLYGVSDIDVLRNNQESMNKILTKMEENILKAGSLVLKPKNINIPKTDETLKVVTFDDPKTAALIDVKTMQANTQQDNVYQEQLYQMGRDSLGITDSYQGKRDTTAESGKAKQVSAAQAAGRMESKRRMKDAAYADLYKLMFKFLLAYCDEPRTYTKVLPTGELIESSFSRYEFLKGEPGNVYYDDRFLFSVDDASTLMTNREALWQEATNNFVSGTFGNPADPMTLQLYWTMMDGLNYPLAKQTLASLQRMSQQLPQPLQDAIMQNPEILNAVKNMVQEGGEGSESSKQQSNNR